jgi:transcriptional regulator with XRE-family HTH domain
VSAESPERLIARIAQRIVELRREASLTQETFAERLDVTVQYVSKIEVGENLTLRSLASIARALGVPVDALFERPASSVPAAKRGRPRRGSPGRR